MSVKSARFNFEVKPGRKSPYDWELAQKLYDQGLTDRLIAEQLGPNCRVKTVFHWREKNDLPSNYGILPRSDNRSAQRKKCI